MTTTCIPSKAAEHGRALLQSPQPTYSGLAKEMHLRGNVILLMTVESDGAVGHVEVQSGHPILAAAAVETVHKWRYAPGPDRTLETVNIKFNFDL